MKTQKNNSIPRGRQALVNFGRLAAKGSQGFGESAGLLHNTAARTVADLYAVIGNPATPEVPGALARLDAHVPVVARAYAAKRKAIQEGRAYCLLAVRLLKPLLGEKWNTAWQAVGFHRPSLRIPAQPMALLTSLRGYLGANPARENAQAGITAARAELLAAAIDGAFLAVADARRERVALKADRDQKLRRLRRRLSSLRNELSDLLSPEDGRWYEFGFRRPADGKIPAPVAEVCLVAGAAGQILATWPASAHAENYRVQWEVLDADGDPIVAGLTAETQFALRDLPSGVTVMVGVTARNGSGETGPTTAQMMVPSAVRQAAIRDRVYSVAQI